jgi:hypothetical protein
MTKQSNSTSSENMTNSPIQSIVMRRVYFIHTAAPLLSTMLVSSVLFIVALWGVGREVWVARVIRNMPSLSNATAVIHFYAAAFLDTRFIVQILSVLVIATSIWLAANIVRILQGMMQFV